MGVLARNTWQTDGKCKKNALSKRQFGPTTKTIGVFANFLANLSKCDQNTYPIQKLYRFRATIESTEIYPIYNYMESIRLHCVGNCRAASLRYSYFSPRANAIASLICSCRMRVCAVFSLANLSDVIATHSLHLTSFAVISFAAMQRTRTSNRHCYIPRLCNRSIAATSISSQSPLCLAFLRQINVTFCLIRLPAYPSS